MIFFSVQKFLKGNLKGSFVVKVFLMGITILDRRILFVKFWLWRALKVESRPSDLPPRYVLRRKLPWKTWKLFYLIANKYISRQFSQFFEKVQPTHFMAIQIFFDKGLFSPFTHDLHKRYRV